MQKIGFKFNLNGFRLIPAGMMAIFAVQTALDFTVNDMLLQSYLMLGMTLLSACFTIFLCIKDLEITKIEFYVLSFLFVIIASSMINITDFKDMIYYTFTAVIPLFLFRKYHTNINFLIYGAVFGFSISILIGFADLLSKPELWMTGEERGAASGYLLGANYNQMGPIFITALIVNILAVKISRWFLIVFIPITIVSITMLVIVNSSTAISGILLLLLFYIIPSRRLQKVGIITLLASVVLFEIFVCFQGKGFENNELARWFVIDILGKDMTFTYRTDMWDSALRVIIKSPLYGFGLPTTDWYLANMSSLAIGPHNMILAILIYGGIIALTLYVLIIFLAMKRVFTSNMYIAFASFAVLSLMMLFEAYSIPIVFFVLILSYYSPEIATSVSKKIIDEQ